MAGVLEVATGVVVVVVAATGVVVGAATGVVVGVLAMLPIYLIIITFYYSYIEGCFTSIIIPSGNPVGVLKELSPTLSNPSIFLTSKSCEEAIEIKS